MFLVNLSIGLRSLTIRFCTTTKAMQNKKHCACEAHQQPQKIIVYLHEKRNIIETDDRFDRLPACHLLDLSSIKYVRSAGKHGNKEFRTIVTEHGIYYTQYPLDEWEYLLPKGIRINKGMVVNLEWVSYINEAYHVYLYEGEERKTYDIAPLYREAFRNILARHCILTRKRSNKSAS
jgi:DNA-binding LytR/AlgR family response regulator